MIFAHFTQSGRQLCLHQKQLPSLSTGMILGAEEWQMVSGYGGRTNTAMDLIRI